MRNVVRLEEKKLWLARKTYVYLVGGVLLMLTLLAFNWYTGSNEGAIIQSQSGLSQPVMGQSTFNQHIEDYLLDVNSGIEVQEEGFISAAGKGLSLEEVLTLPTYPSYRTALNNELARLEQPIQSLRYGTRSSVFSAIFLTYLASIVGVVYLLLVFGDGLSKEMEEGTLRLYHTQPVHKVGLYLTKYGLAVGHAALAVLLFTGMAFGVSLLTFGHSSFEYPVIVFTEKSMTFIPLLQYMGQVCLLFVFVLLFCFALHFLFSVLFGKTIFAFISTIFILLEGHFISISSPAFLRRIAHVNPLTYLNTGKVFVGYDFRDYLQYSIENQEYYANWSLPRVLHNPQIGLSNGLLCLGIGTLVLLAIGSFCVKRSIRLEM